MTQKEQRELLPCPFCGSISGPEVKAGLGESWVLCRNCYASGGMVSGNGDLASALWNTRKAEAKRVVEWCEKHKCSDGFVLVNFETLKREFGG